MTLGEFISSQKKEVSILKVLDAKGTVLKKHILKESTENINFIVRDSS